MKLLTKILVWIIIFFTLTEEANAITVASQNQVFSDQLSAWQIIQELGNNLSGTAASFAFRVSTLSSNLAQFDYTAQNSRIYDKSNNNSYIVGCIPTGANRSDPLRGLIFTTTNAPSGFEDVTIDFSCRNYNFISGHRYLIKITNANMPNYGGKNIKFAAAAYGSGGHGEVDQFSGGGLRYANGNPWDYSHNSGFCSPSTYIWGDPNVNPVSGCHIWTSPQDDLYFTLDNTTPSPTPTPTPATIFPVIFIPGIGGSEFQADQDIIWSKNDGHGGIFSHAYAGGEKLWVNETEAAMPGDDDYFDVLRLRADGQTPEAPLSLTGNLTPFGYADIDSFFAEIGFTKGTNFFVFPYDWRKDVRTTKPNLDSLVEEAKTKSGMPKVNLVAHSMGGLVARNYISEASPAAKINKLIELGVPHLGAVDALKTIHYGSWLGYDYHIFKIGIPPSETKDNAQNMPGIFGLLPSLKYFSLYDNLDTTSPYPLIDDRDIDSNGITGNLNFDQMQQLLLNLGHNSTVIDIAKQFHASLDNLTSDNNGVKIYEIVGSSQPTLGQIKETWWITWPINLNNRYEEVYINGDDTVPLYSASLKKGSIDLSGSIEIYYVDQKHGELVTKGTPSMDTVRTILLDGDSFPIQVKDQKITLEGDQVSVDQDADLDLYDSNGNHTGLNSNGEVEINIPGTFYDTLGNTKHAFVKKSSAPVRVKVKSSHSSTTNIKKRRYRDDQITKTATYQNVPVNSITTVEFTLEPNADATPNLTSGSETILPTSEVTGSAASDLTPPTTTYTISNTPIDGTYSGEVVITLNSSDSGSGVSTTQYSLDNGQTVQTYTNTIHISTLGTTSIQFFSTDSLGNQELPQTITITIVSPTSTPTLTPTSTPTPTLSPTPDVATNTSGVDSSTALISLTSLSSLNSVSEILAPEKPASPLLEQVLGIQTAEAAQLSLNSVNIEINEPKKGRVVRESNLWPLPWFITLPPLILTIIALVSGIIGTFLGRRALRKSNNHMDNPKPKKDIEKRDCN